jgi:hypothetical protein
MGMIDCIVNLQAETKDPSGTAAENCPLTERWWDNVSMYYYRYETSKDDNVTKKRDNADLSTRYDKWYIDWVYVSGMMIAGDAGESSVIL